MKKRNFYQLAHYGRIKGNPLSSEFSGVSCDSRLVQPGHLFIALKGAQTDGHLFLKEAAQKGAVAAIVQDEYKGPHYGLGLLHVLDTLDTLQQLARDVLAEQQSRIVAVTGSLGKTTIKEFLNTILKERYRIMSTPGNANSQIGLPLALLNGLHGNEEIVLCEMGMTHPGNITNLVRIAPPFLAIISCIEAVHACNFKGMDEIARAKAEIFSHHSTAIGLIDKGMPGAEQLKNRVRPRMYAFSKDNQPHADFLYSSDEKDALTIHQTQPKGAPICFPPLNLPGKHNGYNFLIAATAAHLMGMSWEEITARQPFLSLPERRLQFVEKKGVLFVNDSYNASLVSMKAALDSLPEPNRNGRKFAALGEMLELGSLTESHHRAVGKHALNLVDGIFCLGEGCKPIQEIWKKAEKPCRLFMDREALISSLREAIKPGDVVLVKGSRLKEMWKVIDEI